MKSHAYVMAMTFVRPRLEDVPLETALHALADPARLEIVRNLAHQSDLDCECALPSGDIPKSTRSNHFKILRAAGLVETRKEGRRYLSKLRKREFDRRFPKLLDAVLKAQ